MGNKQSGMPPPWSSRQGVLMSTEYAIHGFKSLQSPAANYIFVFRIKEVSHLYVVQYNRGRH